jgi:hypothetical protein
MADITPTQFRTGDIPTSTPNVLQNLNTFMRQAATAAGAQGAAPSWVQVVTYSNGWGPFLRFHVQYAQLPNQQVVFNGLIAGGTVGQPAFMLPKALWPGQDKDFVVNSADAHGKVTVRAADGAVIPAVGSNVFFSLDGLSYWPGS